MMSQEIPRRTDEELLVTHPIRGKAANWFFRLEEVSAGVWQVNGTDRWGRTVSITGYEENDLLARAESKAQQINADLGAT